MLECALVSDDEQPAFMEMPLQAALGDGPLRHFAGATLLTALVLVLPGTRKLKTVCLLTPAPDSLRIEAFVCRNPEENHAGVHEWLLQRNRRLFGIAYTVDAQGDIYLVGQLPPSLADDDLDRLLGQVLEAADGDFNKILERGFSTSIKREWEWRVDRGESLANLQQFRHLTGES